MACPSHRIIVLYSPLCPVLRRFLSSIERNNQPISSPAIPVSASFALIPLSVWLIWRSTASTHERRFAGKCTATVHGHAFSAKNPFLPRASRFGPPIISFLPKSCRGSSSGQEKNIPGAAGGLLSGILSGLTCMQRSEPAFSSDV